MLTFTSFCIYLSWTLSVATVLTLAHTHRRMHAHTLVLGNVQLMSTLSVAFFLMDLSSALLRYKTILSGLFLTKQGISKWRLKKNCTVILLKTQHLAYGLPLCCISSDNLSTDHLKYISFSDVMVLSISPVVWKYSREPTLEMCVNMCEFLSI